MKIAVSLFQRNNSRHLIEYFAWYKMLGVDTYLVYDHMSTDNSYEIIKKLSKFHDIRHLQIPGRNAGNEYWGHMFNHRSSGEFDWIVSADADEFYLPIDHDNLKDVLLPYMDKKLSCLGIYWAMYGNNGHLNWEPGLVTECFTRRAHLNNKLCYHIKSILRGGPEGGNIWYRNDGHRLITEHGTYDVYGRPIFNGLNYPGTITHDILRINHYWAKSLEFFKTVKQVVGQRSDRPAGAPGEEITEEFWWSQNFNDVEDDLAYSKFNKDLKYWYNIMKEQVES
jgi:hypothetical protein